MSKHQLSTNNFGPAKWIVNPLAYLGTHTTISSALTSASSGDTIFIMPATYTENLTLKAGVFLTAYGSDSSTNAKGDVIINGTCTFTGTGTVTIYGIQLQTNSAALLSVTGSSASIVYLNNCYLNCTNNTGITFSSSNAAASINLNNCGGDLATTGIAFHTMSSAGSLVYQFCSMGNSGLSSTISNNISGSSYYFYSSFVSPFGTTSTGSIAAFYCYINSSPVNTASLTMNGSGNNSAIHCELYGGTASAVTIGGTASVISCYVNSTNTNAITGSGTVAYQGLTFGQSKLINTTSQSVSGTLSGGINGVSPTTGMLGEQIRSSASGVSTTSATPINITSITLTAGIWDISAIAQTTFSVTGIAWNIGISTNTGSFTGVVFGDSGLQLASAAVTLLSLSVPSFRVTISTSTTYYLVVQETHATGTSTAIGRISATRVG